MVDLKVLLDQQQIEYKNRPKNGCPMWLHEEAKLVFDQIWALLQAMREEPSRAEVPNLLQLILDEIKISGWIEEREDS